MVPFKSPMLVYNIDKAEEALKCCYSEEKSWVPKYTNYCIGPDQIPMSGGQDIPAFLLSDLPKLTTPYPTHFMLIDSGREGLFRLDITDTKTPDNRGTILVIGGKRYKRAYKGMIEVEWFGAKGNGDKSDASASANTIAIQAACDWATLTSGTPAEPTLTPVNKDRPAVVHVPSGTYYINNTIYLRGAINVKGDGGMSFGGTVITTQSGGYNMFTLAGALGTEVSNAAEIHDMRLLMLNPAEKDVSVIYSGGSDVTEFHSLRVEGVWFQLTGRLQHAYTGIRADDVKFTNCTFDGTVGPCFVLGGFSSKKQVIANMSIQNNTFYQNQGGLIKAINVDGLLFANNRIYGTPEYQTPYVIDALTNSLRVYGLQIIGNRFSRTNRILMTKFNQALVIGNYITHANSRVFEFGGGGTVKDCRFADNIISGTWSVTVNSGGKVVPNAPISSYGTTVSNCEFRNTITDSAGISTTAYYLPLTGTPCNTVDSKLTGFSIPYSVANFDCNVYTTTNRKSSSPASAKTDPSDKAIVRSSLGLSTAATQPKEAFMAASGGKLMSAYNKSFTTTSWSSRNYTQVIAPATLANATIYLVKAVFNKVGLDVIVQSWLVPVTTTYPNSGIPPDLNSNVSIYSGDSGRFIKLRQKPGPVPNTTFGLEATIAKPDMAGSNANLEITITPLF